MWYCPSCGNQNSGNASFCTECGQRKPAPEVRRPAPAPSAPPERQGGYAAGGRYGAPVSPQPQPPQPPRQPRPAKKKKKSLWWLWLLIALLVLSVAGVVCYLTVHIWAPATCIRPETCKICGETRGVALGHTGSEATCTDPSVCIRCGIMLSPPLGHDAPPASCTEPSVCRRCGETVENALGHDWLDATYDRPSTCSRCGLTSGNPKGWIGDLDGDMDSEELTLYENCTSHAYVLTETIHNGYRVTLHIKLTKVEGNPYGSWGLYGRDLHGNWTLLTTFNVDSSAYQNYVAFPLKLDGKHSFNALSMVPMTSEKYNMNFSFYFDEAQEYVD